MTFAIASLIIVMAALILALISLRRASRGGSAKAPAWAREEVTEQPPRIRMVPVRRVNSLAEAAVMLGAEVLMLFDQQGFVIETYNMAEDHCARAAASLAELISIVKELGFPAETIIFKNGVASFIIELERVGDVTPYCLVIGGSALTTDFDYARKILQEYIAGVICRRG
ncbi:MAG: hypothetical protein QXO04_01315 [Nitrososphaerota archaeon]